MDNVENSPTGDLVPPSFRMPCIAMLSRLIHGVATVLLVRPTGGGHSSSLAEAIDSTLPTAGLVCGIAVGTAIERIVATKSGRRSGAVVSWLLVIAGLLVAVLVPTFEAHCVAAFIAGMGMTGDWSSVTEMARNATSARERWKAMRWVTSSFAIGILIGIGVDDAVQSGLIVCVLGGLVIIIFVLLTADIHTANTALNDVASEEVRPCEVKQETPEAEISNTEECATDPDECDSTECCGGSAKEFTPMSYRTGVIVASIGGFAFWGAFGNLFVVESNDTWTLVTAAIGLVIGHVLMRSAAPAGGYTVMLLPFLLGCVFTAFAASVVSVDSPWYAIVGFFVGLFAGGVTSGTSAVLGEQFSDCSSDPQRTRVLSVSLFATALMVLAAVSVNSLLKSPVIGGMLHACVFVVGILAIRSIPSPMISNLGTDEFDAESESELKDIVAAIKQ